MPSYRPADIRNVLLTGHGGSGKTTLADAMLFASGTVNHKGSVTNGSSFSDFEKEEKEHGHSIYSAMLQVNFQGTHINLIDAPGSPDLIGQAIACLPAVDVVLVVINAQSGIEVVTRRMMEAARDLNLPRAIVINRMDLAGADGDFAALRRTLKTIRDTFGHECLPLNMPTRGCKAVVDCVANKTGDSDLGPGAVGEAHAAILDQVVEMDESLMEKYLSGEEPAPEALHAPFVRAMAQGHLIPILFTDAKNGVGVTELLSVIARHFPSPDEANLRSFVTGEGENAKPLAYEANAAKPLLAHVFKVTTDPFIGKLSVFRVHQGSVSGSSQIFIGTAKKPMKLGHVFRIQGKDHPEADVLMAGDIGAVAKIEDIHANDIFEDHHLTEPVRLKRPAFPTPMYGLAVTPKARGDEQKISSSLAKLAEEDPTFKWGHDRQTHEVVIYGLGELHLRLILEKLKNRGLHVDTKPPKIAYHETILARADGHYRHKKQTGGAGQFGEVFLRVEPLERGKGFEFVSEVFGGTIPSQFMPAVEKGVRELLDQGAVAGYPLQDLRVVITDGKSHPVDSKEVAFKTAGKLAFRDAVLKARPALLEPIVNMEVTVPEDKMGIITGDLSGKRGRIMATDVLPGGMAMVKAQAPLSEVMQYQSQLKSVTGGQGSFAMELSHYEAVPPQVQQAIVAAYKPKVEEE